MNWESAVIWLDGLIEKLRKRSNKVSEFWLKSIGKRLRKLKGMDPSDAAGIAAIRNDTTLIPDIMDAMEAAGRDTVQDAKALLQTAARLSADAAPVAKDLSMEEWIDGVVEATQGTLRNLSNTTAVAVVSPEGIVTPGEAYINAVDEVAAQLASGEDGLKRATRKVCEQFADSGLSVVEYESGNVRELGSAVEMNLKQAVHEVYQGVQRRVGQEYGADGVEISAHADCAPDHLECQGKQYTNEEYEAMNGTLRRKIGTWNCRHVIYSIIVGITPPTYSDEELAVMKARSLEKVEFDGKEMTRYEATQVQRRLEREIRKQKNRSVIAAAADEKEMRQDAQRKINQLTDKYQELSDAFGIPTKMERTSVSGYRPVKVKDNITGARITDNYSKEADEFANMYYEEIRLMKADVRQIAHNTGEDIQLIRNIKKYLFLDNSYFNEDTGSYERFAPDCAIAQSWQRLFIGKDIKPHDRTLINHEKLEMEIKRNNPGISHSEAHARAKAVYNYEDEADAYYGSLKKHSKR